jgi:probable rRNA maturation factor
MTAAGGAALVIDVVVESRRWRAARAAKPTVRRAVAAAGAAMSTKRAELAIVLTDDSAIRQLNRRWRGIDAATNVLSFPAAGAAHPQRRDRGAGRRPCVLGDIVLAYQTIAREARAEGKPFAHHLAHLAVHGFLHLLGYDHARTADAARMERLEGRILARLGIADPYRRAAGG